MARFTLLRLLSLLTLTTGPAFAQITPQAPTLKGRVLDAKTHQPIPYASLTLSNEYGWTLANALGRFELANPIKLASDTLLVDCPGYLPRLVVLASHRLADSILTLESTQLVHKNAEPVGTKVSLKQLDSLAKRPGDGMIQGSMGSQYALLMEPSHKHPPGTIRNVSFYIGEGGLPTESFRVRIYRADGPNHSPGTNLLTQNLVVAAPGGGQWFTVDISSYFVGAPRDGFFVAMEWIVAHKRAPEGDNYLPAAQILRPTFEFRDSKTWTFTVGRGWNLLPLKNAESRAYNAMIRAEIEELE